jgi:hypothetical protein
VCLAHGTYLQDRPSTFWELLLSTPNATATYITLQTLRGDSTGRSFRLVSDDVCVPNEGIYC